MTSRFLLAALLPMSAAVLKYPSVAAEPAPQHVSGFSIAPPVDWTRSVDPGSHLVTFAPAGGHVSAIVAASAAFGGSPEQWHDRIWTGLVADMKVRKAASSQRRGNFLTTWGAFDRSDGTQAWICLYTTVKDGRGGGVLFSADGEAAFAANLTSVDRMMDGATFAPAAATVADGNATKPPSTSSGVVSTKDSPPAAANSPVPVAPHLPATSTPVPMTPQPDAPPPAPLPSELTVDTPAGWTRQQDPKTRAIFMKPPDARSVNDAALVVFPAVDFAGTAEQFHSQTLATAVGRSRQLEPMAHGPAGALLVSVVHCLTPQGADVRTILYTARWGNRAQAIVFAADRADLFTKNSPAANLVVTKVAVPVAASPSSSVAGRTPASASAGASASATAGPPSSGTADVGDSIPVLEYTDPPNFFRGAVGGKRYTEFQGSDVNFTLCVYPFQEFQGDIRATFQQTLLRDWIDGMYREESVATQPQFATYNTPGADAEIGARFLDGRQQEHFRIVIVAGRWAAMVDMVAPTAFAWQKGFSSAEKLLDSMRVGKKAAPPSLANGPGAQGAALAGLFQGMRGKTMSNLLLGPGHLYTQTALHYYLFSADGRVYRCYDFPPGGSEAAALHFDFDSAARQDPENSGRFTVNGNQLYMRFGGPNADEITTTITDPNALEIETVRYERKR